MTPMMEQYFEVKKQYQDYILFYRIGDFYEMFYDDAVTASRAIDLTLTGKDCGEPERAPMCGVPFHAAEVYIGKLIEKGFKVAICEQTEDPAKAVGLVKREVIRMVSPGTILESDLLSDKKNNYLCSLYWTDNGIGLAFSDASTSTVFATYISGEDAESTLRNELGTYLPSEVVCNVSKEKLGGLGEFIEGHVNAMLTAERTRHYELSVAEEAVRTQFSGDVTEETLANECLTLAVGGLLGYIKEMEKGDISYIRELQLYQSGRFVEMDLNTRRNLELTQTLRTKEKRGSLLWVLDQTHTAPGARLLKQWMEHPLLSVKEIQTRQDAVEELYESFMLRENLGDALDRVLDLERLITRVVYGTANAKDLRAIAVTLGQVPLVKTALAECKSRELSRIANEIDPLADICQLINQTIVEEPPFSLREGGIIADGFNEQVDYLRSVMHDGRGWIERMTEEEREKTGIKTLKIGYNRVFGYYIEVTKSLLDQVPDRYIRKQTLTGGERFITQELKDMEATILGAEDKIRALEYDLFCALRKTVSDASERIQKVARLLSETDVYLSLATVAQRHKYIKPEVDEAGIISVKDGRHPVVEQFVKGSYFVPNDAYLDLDRNRLLLITGPNMAGKSTYMRQVALIVLLAQIGSFVPAEEARVGIVDKIFTRVGASDDLASGQSTFMLEMNEVAYILKNATRRSLIIYDEVGRGTSTFDGMSIARAILEYTHSKKIGAKTLFATHYHELTSMEQDFDGIVNYHVVAKKKGDDIQFLRKIVRGSTDDSYGIEVAKLAGVPNEVIKRAKEVLHSVEATAKAVAVAETDDSMVDDSVISIGDVMKDHVVSKLRDLDINSLSPYEAMTVLYELQKEAQS